VVEPRQGPQTKKAEKDNNTDSDTDTDRKWGWVNKWCETTDPRQK
jgi:hypothetical protein